MLFARLQMSRQHEANMCVNIVQRTVGDSSGKGYEKRKLIVPAIEADTFVLVFFGRPFSHLFLPLFKVSNNPFDSILDN